jgi:hypothetical protein
MATEMTGLMDQIDSGFKKRGLDTTREGNNVTVQGVKKPDAGAGRGKQGGPTAKELKAYEDKKDANIFTKEKRMPPSPREMASGGKVSSASKRADGCAIRGKTRA